MKTIDQQSNNKIKTLSASVKKVTSLPNNHHVLRIFCPEIFELCHPGLYFKIMNPTNKKELLLPIMRASNNGHWAEFFLAFKNINFVKLLNEKSKLRIKGPYGRRLNLRSSNSKVVLISSDSSFPSLFFFSEYLKIIKSNISMIFFQERNSQYPFVLKPSKICVPGIPDGTIACIPFLEDMGCPSRISSINDFPGCFSGAISELVEHYINPIEEKNNIEIISCGDKILVENIAKLCERHSIKHKFIIQKFV